MSLLRLLLDKGFSIGKTFRFRIPQRTRGGGRAGRMPAPPHRVSPSCLASGENPEHPSDNDVSRAHKPR